MAKLGYTWYPKDWGNSESVFELNLSERGLYRELIDLSMLNDNKTEIKMDVWIRKFSVSIESLNSILEKLNKLGLIQIEGEKLFIPSCENRLKLVRGGSKGGKNSKPLVKPFKSLTENNNKPTYNQIETKIETKLNENESLLEIFFNDLPNSKNLESIENHTKIKKDKLISIIPNFRKSCNVSYPNFNAFCDHFKRWANIHFNEPKETSKIDGILDVTEQQKQELQLKYGK